LSFIQKNIENINVLFSTEHYLSRFWLLRKFTGGRIHELKVTKLLLENLEPETCFVDVGAHLGYYTILASNKLTNGEVVSFEMDKTNYNILMKNIALNKCTNVEAHNSAVTNSVGISKYVTNVILTSAMSRLDKKVKYNKKKSKKVVKTITLNEFFKENYSKPDVIKIDVEGSEMDVLNGMDKILDRKKKLTMFIEIHPGYLKNKFQSSSKEVIDKLLEKGFNIFQIKNFRGKKKGLNFKEINSNSKLKFNTILFVRK